MKSKTKKRTRKVRKQRGGQAPPSVYVFYHIFCNENTKPVVIDQLNKIVFSGLYKKATKIYCFLTGSQAEITELSALVPKFGKKIEVAATGPDDKTYERFTLLKIHEYVKPDDKFLYIHSKGVSKGSFECKRGDQAALENVFWWRTLMEYQLIARFQKCLELLDSHDLVGTYYEDHKIGPHFSGNFWWSTGKYYASLPKEIGTNYDDPEAYIFKGTPKYAEIASELPIPGHPGGLYKTLFALKEYVDSDI